MAVLTSRTAEAAAGAQLVTSPVYGLMKKEIRARDDGGWRRVEWDLPQPPTLREIEVVHGRLIYLNPKVRPTLGLHKLTGLSSFRATRLSPDVRLL